MVRHSNVWAVHNLTVLRTWTKIIIVVDVSNPYLVIILVCLSKLLTLVLSKSGTVSSYNHT